MYTYYPLHQPILDFDPIQFFQQGFGSKLQEDPGCSHVDAIDGDIRNIVPQYYLPTHIIGVHNGLSRVHDATTLTNAL